MKVEQLAAEYAMAQPGMIPVCARAGWVAHMFGLSPLGGLPEELEIQHLAGWLARQISTTPTDELTSSLIGRPKRG